MTQPDDLQHFDFILRHLQQTRGFDFAAYKRPSLMRRVLGRMQVVGIASFEAYFDYLQARQEELDSLVKTVLISVTGFFRDPDVWHYMRNEGLPRMLAARSRTESFRVWSAGCASGQEAYSVLMLLCELLGAEAVRDRVKIYATDADEDGLTRGRLASYSAKEVDQVPPDLIEKYFDRSGGVYTFKRELQQSVIFWRHNLVQDAPIPHVDLLLCRNTLMYFNADAQARILARFFFALKPSGYILLGRAELPFNRSAVFTPVDLKSRLFTVDGNSARRPAPLRHHDLHYGRPLIRRTA